LDVAQPDLHLRQVSRPLLGFADSHLVVIDADHDASRTDCVCVFHEVSTRTAAQIENRVAGAKT
jgi:hypothetical protein